MWNLNYQHTLLMYVNGSVLLHKGLIFINFIITTQLLHISNYLMILTVCIGVCLIILTVLCSQESWINQLNFTVSD